MARQKAAKYAEELGIVKPTTAQFEALVDACIFSARDRHIMKRYLIDDVPASALVDEVSAKFPYAPAEELTIRRIIRRGINTISKYV